MLWEKCSRFTFAILNFSAQIDQFSAPADSWTNSVIVDENACATQWKSISTGQAEEFD